MVQSLRLAAPVLFALFAFPPVLAAQAPSDLRGIWSADPACDENALRHIIGERGLEWREGSRRLAYAETRVQLRGDQIRFEIRSADPTDGPIRAGDVVRYRRVPGGLVPIAIDRAGVVIDLAADRPFVSCRR